jgi:citrate/tricarballylate utilization protein
MHATDALTEADRLMTVCNSCRYCEGLCAVFPAMEARRAFPDGDLNYLANLCHGCGACYYDCQFSPPHEFAVNIPKVLAKVRTDSYADYAWPPMAARLFRRNGLAIAIIAALSVALFILGFVAASDPTALWMGGQQRGAFYRVMPHGAMAGLFGASFLYAIVALCLAVRRFWTDIGETTIGATAATRFNARSIWQAVKDAGRLRYLDGGGLGCMNDDDRPRDGRRHAHHMVFYGFILCFASTSVATLYHYLLGREAPYPWYDLPVVLGTLGGLGLVSGTLGLYRAKRTRDPILLDAPRLGMDAAFLAMLFLTGLSGLALLVLRDTRVMGILLALHLGIVFALFITMPYGKFVHGIYRFAALVRYARDRDSSHA